MENSSPIFGWEAFYTEFADKLLGFKNNRKELLRILEDAYAEVGQKFPFMEKTGEPVNDICPFTIFGAFNKGTSKANRIALMQAIGNRFGIASSIPSNFDGIPVLNNMRAWYFGYLADRQPDDIDNLWHMMEAAMCYADKPDDGTHDAFVKRYDLVSKQSFVGWNLTMGLYWMRPRHYLNLDRKNRDFLLHGEITRFADVTKISSLKDIPDGKTYLDIVNLYLAAFSEANIPVRTFPQLSRAAWLFATTGDSGLKHPTGEKQYWLYAPGPRAVKWEEFYETGIMGIGWDELGDLSAYKDRESMQNKLKEIGDRGTNYTNDSLKLWQFVHDVKIGDVIFAKKGKSEIVGRGVVVSDYIYEQQRDEYRHVRKVNWTNEGNWEHPGKAVVKTLTNITDYTDYVQELNSLFVEDEVDEPIDEKTEITYASYSENDFLKEVFMKKERYQTLVNLLKIKKNIIIQGAPGVGKTFVAKRLAYSMIGEKDTDRVKMVQFHQSYSYEDFIMGFRPIESGFKLTEGPFYTFCKKADGEHKDHDCFFIIDEINRGNLSKIFGELLMLIENDKRGEKLRLLYENELFSVPNNVHLIGLMNTADRSLAMIDYALRRRFAFFDMEPAFDSEGFKNIIEQVGNDKFSRLIKCIQELNVEIGKDESLGDGFRIGHSYFCPKSNVDDTWLEQVVKYEICPLLSEYWFDNKGEYETWKKRLEEVIK